MTATIFHVDFGSGRLNRVERPGDPEPAPEPVVDPYAYFPRYCDPDNEFRGSRYNDTSSMDIAEIAKLVRKDIKAAKKSGKLPKALKTSVRISRFSMGQSLDITVKALPFPVVSLKWHEWKRTDEASAGYHPPVGITRYTPEANEVRDVLKGIMNSYNRDNSDAQVDYFDVRFYGDVSFDYDLTSAEDAAIAAKLGPGPWE